MLGNGISPLILSFVVVGYFLLLYFISRWTSKGADTDAFFTAKKASPWYLVAFGMIGATLSGVTFISVPGWVASSQFSYMQMVLGYILGYFIIGTVLMPMYYKMNLTSIYGYLEDRFGYASYKTGAAFFMISRIIGAAFRLYLVAIVFQAFIMDSYGIPIWITVLLTIVLIWTYTHKGGIKTIVWTDTLQTTFMLVAVIATLIAIGSALQLSLANLITTVSNSEYSQMFFLEGGWTDGKFLPKQFIAGAFIAVVMTGLDQDMMQKNLTCKSLGDAQKNMFWFTIILVFAKLLFLFLGALLFIYATESGITLPEKSDLVYPEIALNHLPAGIGIVFILGLIAAAYSSADSALTALTTSFCVDFLGFDTQVTPEMEMQRKRRMVHLGFSVILFLVILIFHAINDDAVIKAIFTIAGYTYGPLLGLYAFGFMTKVAVRDKWVPLVCLLSPILTYLINVNSDRLLAGYKFGFELLVLNGLITFLGLWALSKKKRHSV